MRNSTSIFIIFTLIIGQVYSQTNISVYKDLEVKKFYAVSIDAGRNSEGKYEYRINGKEVSKNLYEKFQNTWKNIDNCRPCILQTYDEKDILLTEAVSYTDALVGSYKEFYPNGNLKIIGQFKENSTGNWENLCDRGLCNVEDGQWIYFDQNGDTLYSEYWVDGLFLYQEPEQDSTEIWKMEVLFNGMPVKNQSLTVDQINQITFVPKFKNSSTDGIRIIVRFDISTNGYKTINKFFSIENFKDLDVLELLLEAGITLDKNPRFIIWIHTDPESYFEGLHTYLTITD